MTKSPIYCLAVACLMLACGGGQSRTTTSAGERRADDESRHGKKAAHAGDDEPSLSALPSCDDGTCFRCGGGICPKGFYCDEDAKGGAACAWLPSCPDEASCSCVKQALGASCRCEEQGAGVSVSCD